MARSPSLSTLLLVTVHVNSANTWIEINEEEAISQSTMLEIERIRKKGIIFVVATNRLYQEVLDYNTDFPFIDYIVSLNGSIVYDVQKRKIIHKKKMTEASIKNISKLYEKNTP